jgi:hypothetical protein
MTVAELCDLYLSESGVRIKPSTLALDRSRIERHVKPLLGRRTVRSLTAEDVERMQLDIAAGKSARPRAVGRGSITTGGRVWRRARSACSARSSIWPGAGE